MVPKRVSKKALKIEDKRLLDYELVLIISPEVDEEKLESEEIEKPDARDVKQPPKKKI